MAASHSQAHSQAHSPSSAFVGAAWLALIIGVAMYLVGLFNATMALNEKGYANGGLDECDDRAQ